jgi:recombination protein RecT
MANPAAIKNALAKQDEKPPQSIQTLIQNASKELGRALPAHLSADRLVRIALTSLRLTPDLAKCTSESFLGSLFVLAQVGLEPVAGRAYLIPFNNRRKVGNEWKSFKEVQAIIGFKGYVDLFYRHESSLSIDAQTVHEKDVFEYEHGTNAFLKHRPAMKGRGDPIAYYAVAKLKGGASLFFVISKEDALEHGKQHSKTYDKQGNKFYDGTPWAKEFDSMAKKTAIIQLSKFLPLSIELQRAIGVDETSRDYREGIDSALDMPITGEWSEVPEGETPKPETPPTPTQPPPAAAKKSDPDAPGDASEPVSKDPTNFQNFK